MATPIQTPSFGSIPPFAKHSVTVHMPGWDNLLKFSERDPEIMAKIKNMYPRMLLHRDIAELIKHISEKFDIKGKACFIYSTWQAAHECKSFAISSLRGETAAREDEIMIRVFDIHVRVYAVFFPPEKRMEVFGYYTTSGLGITSRKAEDALKNIELLREVTNVDSPAPTLPVSPAHLVLKERIVGLLERAPVGPPRQKKVSTADIYFYPSGMGAIYSIHQLLLTYHQASTVLFGFAFHNTIHVFEDWPNSGFKFLGLGTSEDIDTLSVYLESETKEGRKVGAVFAEFPSNPNIITPDLIKLRKLADKYRFVLVVDDTIASFCNVDLLGVADILITSLSKSFNGYADLLAGSAIINPFSPFYDELKSLLDKSYINEFYNGDAEDLEKNSRDYLQRSTILNQNAARATEYLQSLALDPKSSISKVFYVPYSKEVTNYTPFMRPKTEEFIPGYGCLFSVELATLPAFIAFYENLHCHIGPHLGAQHMLALPYVKALYPKQLDWAANYNLKATQIRIAVGLEDSETIIQIFKTAIEAADKVFVNEMKR